MSHLPQEPSRTPSTFQKYRALLPCLVLVLLPTAAVFAGGQLETFDFTGMEPGPVAGSTAVDIVPIAWDSRCVPVEYHFNTAVSANTSPFLDVDETRALLQTSFDSWNDIPTSFIEMRFGDDINRPRTGPFDLAAFDFINEVNFLGLPGDPIAASPSVSLTADADLSPGMDLDGDGDGDIFDPAVTGLDKCADVDGDGDIEFPAGFYRAGTILDNDVFFNNGTLWTTGPPDAVAGQLDLQAVSTHEFGHSHGLSHTALNQQDATDGTSPTMINGVPSTDPESELSLRTLEADDIAWSSFVYPEGSSQTGVAALQPGDTAFRAVYGVIRGEVTHGASGLPLAGASVFAAESNSGRLVTSHYTGRTRLASVPGIGLDIFEDQPEFHLVSGSYTLPVPAGKYHVGIEALDGSPNSTGSIGTTTIISGFFDLQNFNEGFFPFFNSLWKFWPRRVRVRAGREVNGIDHTTPVDHNLDAFDLQGFSPFSDFDSLGFFDAPPNRIFAVHFPAEEIQSLIDQNLIFKGAAFRNFQVDRAVSNVFSRASLVTGHFEDGSPHLDLDHPLAENESFLGQDNDFSPLYFSKPILLTWRLQWEIWHGTEDFFLVLELPSEFPGLRGLPPFIGLDFGQQVGQLGRSYFSDDGGVIFVQDSNLNYMFRLIAQELHHP
ncbi:MAG: hypothetical protein K0U98_13100 [Deltaproteobacteria bacterium]|nr:hypothetical protein [Deltaproteobacteria bacterium]